MFIYLPGPDLTTTKQADSIAIGWMISADMRITPSFAGTVRSGRVSDPGLTCQEQGADQQGSGHPASAE